MALKQMNQTETATQFEEEGAAAETAVQETVQNIVQETAVVADAGAKTTALAKANPHALTAREVMSKGSLSVLKDSFHVEWNSVPRILAASGQFKFKEDDHKLGEEISMTLISYQDRWVCSPNDDKADKELVKYSDDGVTATDGTDLKEHLAVLKEDWVKAKIEKRMVIMGELTSESGKTESGKVGELVQIDLPPTGMGAFNTYILQAAYAVGKSKKTFEETQQMKLKAVAISKPYEYTKIVFEL